MEQEACWKEDFFDQVGFQRPSGTETLNNPQSYLNEMTKFS